MERFTEEEYNILLPYVSRMRTAIDANYTRAIWESDIKKILPIYERVIGHKHNMCNYCASSKLKLIQEIGKLFLPYYDKIKEKKDIEDGKDIKRGLEEKGKVCKQVNSRGQQPKSGNRRSSKKV